MQQNIQQIPQPQMMVQNSQIQMANPQLYQVVQTNSTPNICEKFSKLLTGSYNIPLTVFLILMGSLLVFIIFLIVGPSFLKGLLLFSSLGNFLFALFVWCPMAIKIEKNTSTVRYLLLFLINKLIISIFSLGLQTNWNFILFETLLIALSNRNKRMKFFCCKMSGNAFIISSVVYNLIFNFFLIYPLIITLGYTYVYRRWLITKLAISNEKVEKYENYCLFNCLKNRLNTFITLKDVLEREKQHLPLVENNNNDMQNVNESSFVPMNMYPNYYSGVAPGIQMQPLSEEVLPNVNSNQNL